MQHPDWDHLQLDGKGRVFDTRRGAWRKLATLPNGYMCIQEGRRTLLVHRLTYQAYNPGENIEGKVIRHMNHVRDDNRIENLRSGSSSDNMQDCISAGRHKHANHNQKSHCPEGHAYVLGNLVKGALKAGKRSCRSCQYARSTVSNKKIQGHDISHLRESIADARYCELLGV